MYRSHAAATIDEAGRARGIGVVSQVTQTLTAIPIQTYDEPVAAVVRSIAVAKLAEAVKSITTKPLAALETEGMNAAKALEKEHWLAPHRRGQGANS